MMNDADISLLEVVRIIRKRIVLIAGFVFASTFFSFVVCKMTDKTYQAKAVLLPIGGGEGVNSLPGGFFVGNLLSMMGQGTSAGNKLVLFMECRSFSERVVSRFNLVKDLYTELWDKTQGEWKVKDPSKIPSVEDAGGVLRGMMDVREFRDKGIITVEVEAKDPVLAAKLTNHLVDELQLYIQDNEFSEAKRNRLFIGRQLGVSRKEYLESGKELTEYYQLNKVSAAIPVVNVDIGKGLESDVPPSVTGLGEQVEVFNRQKSDVDQQLQKLKSVSNVPQQVYLEYLTMKRILMGQINASLTQQYELAKIMESKEHLSFQVIDEARPPGGAYRPKTRKIMMAVFFISGCAVVFLFVFWEYFRKSLRGEAKA